jgi:hypothetical protein
VYYHAFMTPVTACSNTSPSRTDRRRRMDELVRETARERQRGRARSVRAGRSAPASVILGSGAGENVRPLTR